MGREDPLDFVRERVKKEFPGSVQVGNPRQLEGPELPVLPLQLSFLQMLPSDLLAGRFLGVFPRVLRICAFLADCGLERLKRTSLLKEQEGPPSLSS